MRVQDASRRRLGAFHMPHPLERAVSRFLLVGSLRSQSRSGNIRQWNDWDTRIISSNLSPALLGDKATLASYFAHCEICKAGVIAPTTLRSRSDFF